MDILSDISAILSELDAMRIARNMSYQDVADRCGVSRATVYRALTGSTEPSMHLIQSIAAAVQYEPPQSALILTGSTQEDYIAFLQSSIQRQADETDRRIRSLHAHYNGLRRQDRRIRNLWAAIAIVLTAAFVALFVFDFLHLDRGWIQAALTSASAEHTSSALLSFVRKIGASLWTA